MSFSSLIAKNLRDVHFGGNWTFVNLKDTLSGISWEQATQQVHSFNTIATLVNHINYYIVAVTKVLEGEALNASDKLSFTHPPINNSEDWDTMVNRVWADAEKFAALIEQVPDEKLVQDFEDGKYGNYYRNLQGITEHMHYHLGQISLLKKWILENHQAG